MVNFLFFTLYWKHVPYNLCTSLIWVLYFISIFLDCQLGFKPTLQLKRWNLRALQNENHIRASILNTDGGGLRLTPALGKSYFPPILECHVRHQLVMVKLRCPHWQANPKRHDNNCSLAPPPHSSRLLRVTRRSIVEGAMWCTRRRLSEFTPGLFRRRMKVQLKVHHTSSATPQFLQDLE